MTRGVLVDTSVWVDHFRNGNDVLVDLLHQDLVLIHPLVIGEIACGTPPNREATLNYLQQLRPSDQVNLKEVLSFIERESLYGFGCGLIDLQLLTSTMLTPRTTLWTLDARLATLAKRFSVEFASVQH